MPSPATANLPKPRSEDEFEDICVDYLRLKWRADDVQRNGRRGQRQDGVDIFSVSSGAGVLGAQCKKTQHPTFRMVVDEYEKALSFEPSVSHFFFLTSADRDANLQKKIRLHWHQHEMRFPISLVFWEDICGGLAVDPDLISKHWTFWGEAHSQALAILRVAQALRGEGGFVGVFRQPAAFRQRRENPDSPLEDGFAMRIQRNPLGYLGLRVSDVLAEFDRLDDELQYLESTWAPFVRPECMTFQVLSQQLARFREGAGLVGDACVAVAELPVDSHEVYTEEILSHLESSVDDAYRVRRSLHYLEAEIHEVSCFGGQPPKEQTRQMVDRLFGDLCSRWKAEDRSERRIWRGVTVLDSLGEHDWLLPDVHLVGVSCGSLAELFRRLPCLAHLAAHQVLHHLPRCAGTAQVEIVGLLGELAKTAQSKTQEYRYGLESVSAERPELGWIAEILPRFHAIEIEFGELAGDWLKWEEGPECEVLADLLSFVFLGPAAVTSIAQFGSHRDQGLRAHPPTWMRVLFGRLAFLHLQASTDQYPWFGQELSRDEEGFWTGYRIHRPEYRVVSRLLNGSVNGLPAGCETDDLTLMQQSLSNPLLDSNLYLILALASDSFAMFWRFRDWCQKHSASSVYYETSRCGYVAPDALDRRAENALAIARSITDDASALCELEDTKDLLAAIAIINLQGRLAEQRVREVVACLGNLGSVRIGRS